jgi:hypothetical protein
VKCKRCREWEWLEHVDEDTGWCRDCLKEVDDAAD